MFNFQFKLVRIFVHGSKYPRNHTLFFCYYHFSQIWFLLLVFAQLHFYFMFCFSELLRQFVYDKHSLGNEYMYVSNFIHFSFDLFLNRLAYAIKGTLLRESFLCTSLFIQLYQDPQLLWHFYLPRTASSVETNSSHATPPPMLHKYLSGVWTGQQDCKLYRFTHNQRTATTSFPVCRVLSRWHSRNHHELTASSFFQSEVLSRIH